MLAKGGYGMKGILPLEEFIDHKREEYYLMLEESERDLTEYIVFMLQTIDLAANETKTTILKKQNVKKEDLLLPRRAEIYQIIKEHKLVNIDFIRRRFIKVNQRTLRYDLKKLQDQGFIRKRGTTRGVYYEII